VSVVVLLSSEIELTLVPLGIELATALDTECAVLSAAPATLAQPLLERARSLGVRRGCNVWADLLGECDFLAVARVLAAAIGNLGGEGPLVLAGHGRRGAVPAAIADLLACPYLGSVTEVTAEADGLHLVRDAGRALGHYRRNGACVLGVYPTGEAPPRADREVTGEIVHWTLADIGLAEPEISYRRRFLPRPVDRRPAEPVRLTLGELRSRLSAEGLVTGDA
jgi:electron transfer flavoprotein alpha/beta subunit